MGPTLKTDGRGAGDTLNSVASPSRARCQEAKLPCSRRACGYKLANDGHDTRATQHYLSHRNIQITVRYTQLSAQRFKDFWKH
jgi:site-specific recombinase XerD